MNLSLDAQFAQIKADFEAKAGKDYAASRGEFLNSIIMANYLGIQFIDAAEVIFFNEEGNLNDYKTIEIILNI